MRVTFNEDELNVIGHYLIDAPYGHVATIFEKISDALQEEAKGLTKEINQFKKEVTGDEPVAAKQATGKRINGSPRADAPYGLKKDGTPKKRPGRPALS